MNYIRDKAHLQGRTVKKALRERGLDLNGRTARPSSVPGMGTREERLYLGLIVFIDMEMCSLSMVDGLCYVSLYCEDSFIDGYLSSICE